MCLLLSTIDRADQERELEKVTNGLKASEKKESEFADQLSEIEQADTGADLAELRRVRLISFTRN